MAIGRLLHGDPQHDTGGSTISNGRAYDLFGTIVFAGRRDLVFTRLAALSGAHPGDDALDIGCGTGYLTRRMAQAVSASGTVLGIDPSPAIIDHARSRARTLPNCRFERGIAEELHSPDASFDSVVSSLMIHHLPEQVRQKAVCEMYRVLRPGGRLLVADFRPPGNPLARHLVGAVTGPDMEHNPIDHLEDMVRTARFESIRTGDLHPWIRYVTARRPGTDGPAA
ncbi:class I SAM-dependent methyltransferase [Kitasatospora sp. NBC_01539]|uniref:class I SAM-dependent methyltransferase n=1 Tax=Kitasatospora sp. NBC_01539 TaxID=2903577 RepID=UPI00386019E9